VTAGWVWAPRRLTWWIAVLFMVGSALFALGSLPPYFENVSPRAVGVTFFAGSVFFTAAATGQFLDVVRSPRDLDWWAALVQLAGTLWFNVTTYDAMATDLTTKQTDKLVWAPDAIGSICFLVASYLALFAICHRWSCWCRRDPERRIAALNMAGSVAFGLSAVAAYVLPTTGEAVNIRTVNVQTFLGAACFFVAAYLLVARDQESLGATPG
jgi:YrhK-like protein